MHHAMNHVRFMISPELHVVQDAAHGSPEPHLVQGELPTILSGRHSDFFQFRHDLVLVQNPGVSKSFLSF